ncbi:MAG: hypothetical protein HDT42_03490 [Ruminococcaceae bacterium]|nr:hypothetical protein [Oscillospiraceae bacterium]
MYRFVMYNGSVYRDALNIFTKKQCFVTQFKEKTDDSFYDYLDYLDSYARDIGSGDIYDLYEVDFYVVYNDTSKTTEAVAKELKAKEEEGRSIGQFARDCILNHMWGVNEEIAYRLPAEIENNEVAIAFNCESCSEDWVELKSQPGGFSMRGWCSKIVDIHDCDRLFVRYTYRVRNGKDVPYDERVVEVTMNPEDFKAEMLKHRIANI